jgi:hypothetical protein
MEISLTSIVFAKAFGIYLTIVGVALISHPERFRVWYNDILAKDSQSLLGGTLALFIGVFIIAMHNLWVKDWRILITVIGYWGLFKGAGLLIFPSFSKNFKPMIDSTNLIYRIMGFGFISYGLLLFYHGYFRDF